MKNLTPKLITSKEILEDLKHKVFDSNISCTINTFSGSWVYSYLLAITRDYYKQELLENKIIAIPFSINTLLIDRGLSYSNVVDYIENYFPELETKQPHLNSMLSSIINESNGNIKIIISGLNNFSRDGISLALITNTINNLQKLYPKGLSFVYVNTGEFDISDEQYLEKISTSFLQNTLWGKEFLPDKTVFENIILNETIPSGVIKVSKEFINKVAVFANNDPTTTQIIARTLVSKKSKFGKNFIKEKSVSKIYNLIGLTKLDARFNKIIDGLQKQSYECLVNNYNNPTEFLLRTGLVKDGKPINPLFDYFIENRMKQTVTTIAVPKGSVKDKLTGQEVLLFELLSKGKNNLITKDNIAETIWGTEWENVYSDWAIDRLVSNLRKKLKDNDYHKSIKTLKGRGIMFT